MEIVDRVIEDLDNLPHKEAANLARKEMRWLLYMAQKYDDGVFIDWAYKLKIYAEKREDQIVPLWDRFKHWLFGV